MNKPLRVALVAFIVGLTMLLHTPNAYAETVFTDITCANLAGEQVTRSVGWDNSNQYFADKGDIARHYCEGGFAGPYTIYIGDLLAADDPRRYYAGIAPTPTASPEPTITTEPTPTPTLEPSPTPTLEPSLEPTPTPTLEPQPEPTPTLSEPTLAPEVPVVPTIEPTPTQTPEPKPTPLPELPTALPKPTAEPSPTPIEPSPVPSALPSLNPEAVTLDVPTQLAEIPGIQALAASVEAIMNVGSDMTPEQREESQSVVIGAVLVTQIASSIRRIK
jgi:hypothetical protein